MKNEIQLKTVTSANTIEDLATDDCDNEDIVLL